MPECYACQKSRSRTRTYLDFHICRKCFKELGLGPLENTSIRDEFIEKIVQEEDRKYIDGLNAFASKFPKKFSKDLLQICLMNLNDEDMDGVTISSFIISARAILLFGNDAEGEIDLDSEKLHFLLALANLIGVSIIASLARGYEESGMEIEDDEIMADIGLESLMTFLSILNEIRSNDPQKELREEIIAMFCEITTQG